LNKGGVVILMTGEIKKVVFITKFAILELVFIYKFINH
jgi:hypothetical protein